LVTLAASPNPYIAAVRQFHRFSIEVDAASGDVPQHLGQGEGEHQPPFCGGHDIERGQDRLTLLGVPPGALEERSADRTEDQKSPLVGQLRGPAGVPGCCRAGPPDRGKINLLAR
jgi:hypothetical protein